MSFLIFFSAILCKIYLKRDLPNEYSIIMCNAKF